MFEVAVEVELPAVDVASSPRSTSRAPRGLGHELPAVDVAVDVAVCPARRKGDGVVHSDLPRAAAFWRARRKGGGVLAREDEGRAGGGVSSGERTLWGDRATGSGCDLAAASVLISWLIIRMILAVGLRRWTVLRWGVRYIIGESWFAG